MSILQHKKSKDKKGFHYHHIIPKHFGGTDEIDNLVLLSPIEHAEAHLELYRKYNKPADAWAYNRLIRQIGLTQKSLYVAPNKGKKFSKEVNSKKGRFGSKNAMSRPEVKERHYKAILETAKTGVYSHIGGKNPAAKRIVVGGIEYQCINDVAKALGKNRCTIREWLKKGKL